MIESEHYVKQIANKQEEKSKKKQVTEKEAKKQDKSNEDELLLNGILGGIPVSELSNIDSQSIKTSMDNLVF